MRKKTKDRIDQAQGNDKLRVVQECRNEAADQIKALADRQKEWDTDDRNQWSELNQEYDELIELRDSMMTEQDVTARAEMIAEHDRQVNHMAGGNTGTGSRPASQSGTGFAFRDVATGREVRALRYDEELTDPQHRNLDIGRMIFSLIASRPDVLTGSELEEMRASSVSSDVAGGYLLGQSMSSRFIDLARSSSVALRAGAQTIGVDSAEMTLAKLTADPTASWKRELASVTASTPTFGTITLRPKTLIAIVPVSVELLEDASNAANIITQALSSQMALKLDQAVLAGDGSAAEPIGIRNADDTNSVASVGTPSDYSDLTTAVKDVFAANYAGEASGLSWIGHPRDFATYDGLADSTGQPLQPTPWAGELKKYPTSSVATDEGGGSDESYAIVGDMSQVLIGLRRRNVVIEILRAGQVTDAAGSSINAATDLARFIRVYLRADVAIMRPSWFSVLSGITA